MFTAFPPWVEEADGPLSHVSSLLDEETASRDPTTSRPFRGRSSFPACQVRPGSRGLVVLVLLIALALILGAPSGVAYSQVSVHLVQTFFVPLPEEQVRTALVALTGGGDVVGDTMRSVVSIVATLDGTLIYYDHWEDGFESDIAHPTQPTTEIWGDGDPTNGIPPGYATDFIDADDSVVLEDDVTLPRDPAQLRYDGGDRFGATRIVVVTRAEWALDPGTVLAGAVEVYNTDEYGTAFAVPIGEDVSANNMFDYVSLLVMAAQDGTTVEIDQDGDGTVDVTVTLDQGESYQVAGGVQSGALVTATAPVQAHLITGDPNGYYESRWYALYPVDRWAGGYITPVGTSAVPNADDQETYIFIYNPHSAPIPVRYETQATAGSFSVPAGGVYRYEVPQDSGARFYTDDGTTFFAVAAVGADPALHTTYDWGFSLVPESELTTVAIVGWGPGNGADDPTTHGNGSPVWVTAVTTTTLYVDYDSDPTTGPLVDPEGNRYDAAYALFPFQSLRVFDDTDNDQSGLRAYTLDGTRITAAWGQDPATAGPGTPYLDLGTTVLPLHPRLVVDKELASQDGGELTPNYITFTITISNVGSSLIAVLPLRDVYDPYYLSFLDATPYPEEDADDGEIAWHDLTGPAPRGFGRDLPPGEAFVVTATFAVVHDIISTTNTAIVSDVIDVYDNEANDDEDEVEIDDIPTPVELLYFRASAGTDRQVRLEWATAVEVDTFGFNLYRAAEPDRARSVPVGFVPAQGRGGGAAYTCTDEVPDEGIWWYWLAEVNTVGAEAFYGPVRASVGVAALPYRLYLPIVVR